MKNDKKNEKRKGTASSSLDAERSGTELYENHTIKGPRRLNHSIWTYLVVLMVGLVPPHIVV